jgi:hypothetical protein
MGKQSGNKRGGNNTTKETLKRQQIIIFHIILEDSPIVYGGTYWKRIGVGLRGFYQVVWIKIKIKNR